MVKLLTCCQLAERTAVILLNITLYTAKAMKLSDDKKNEKNDLDWWQTAVFYQIYPRSFKDGNGDGLGDLKGIEEKAEHFKDIGVDCVWLSPIFKSPMADFGYDISDYNQVDSTFGTMDDFISLLRRFKSLDLKIILDFVPNHSSDEHEWFKKSEQKIDPYTDYYVWKDAKIDQNGLKVPPNNWNNLRFWLNLGVDGYRVDAVPFLFEDPEFSDEPRIPEELASKEKITYKQYIHSKTKDLNETYDMISQFRDVLDEYNQKDGKTRVLITEAYTTLSETMKYYGNDTNPGAHMPLNFGLITSLNDQSGATDFNAVVLQWLRNMPPGGNANWEIGNHDRPRVATRMGSQMVDAMNMLNLLLPGTAFTYLGEEIGMENTNVRWDQTVDPRGLNAGQDGFRQLSRDSARTPYQWNGEDGSGFSSNSSTWLPVNPNYWQLNLAEQKEQPRSHYAVYKRLTALRKTLTIQQGAFEGHVLSEWVFAFTRSFQGTETYVVVINLGSEYQTVDLSGLQVIKDKDLMVHTSSVNSEYFIGNKINKNGFKMRTKSALVLTTDKNVSTSSATSLVFPLKITLVILACVWISICSYQGA